MEGGGHVAAVGTQPIELLDGAGRPVLDDLGAAASERLERRRLDSHPAEGAGAEAHHLGGRVDDRGQVAGGEDQLLVPEEMDLAVAALERTAVGIYRTSAVDALRFGRCHRNAAADDPETVLPGGLGQEGLDGPLARLFGVRGLVATPLRHQREIFGKHGHGTTVGGRIAGRVEDIGGNGLPLVSVVLHNGNGEYLRELETDLQGNYDFGLQAQEQYFVRARPAPGGLAGELWNDFQCLPDYLCEDPAYVFANGTPIADVAISQRVAFSHALIDGRSVSEFDRGGKAAGEIDRLWTDLKRELRL